MKWYLTQAGSGEPEIDIREGDEDLSRGYSMMRELAAMDHGLQEIEPGVWWARKEPGTREV
jgi:hypothetical protein